MKKRWQVLVLTALMLCLARESYALTQCPSVGSQCPGWNAGCGPYCYVGAAVGEAYGCCCQSTATNPCGCCHWMCQLYNCWYIIGGGACGQDTGTGQGHFDQWITCSQLAGGRAMEGSCDTAVLCGG